METNVPFDVMQKEVARAILNLEDKWSQKHLEYDSKITAEISKMELQLSDIIRKQEDFTEFTQIQNIKNQKQDDIIQQIDKINDQLMSLDIRIRNNAKELSDAIYKYDYLYLNNLLLPGHIGESCKFKNLREFLDYAITQISSFDMYKEKQNVDLKTYKEKLESIIKGFNMQIERIKNANMVYSNEKVFELKQSVGEQIKDIYANLPEIQMKNHQFVIKLKKQINELIKEREMISKMREEFLLDMSTKCNQIMENNHHTNSQIGEYKAEFAKIKRSYIELAEFIKDVRFKRNINSEVSKTQLKKLAFKLSKEKEKLSEDQIEECHQRKVDDLLESIIKNGDIKHLTEYQNQANTSQTSRKNGNNDIILDSISEGESMNMTTVLGDENNKADNSNSMMHTGGTIKDQPKSQKRLVSSFSSTATTRLRRVSLTQYQQPTMKKMMEGNEKRIKEIEELTQAKIKELENRINNFQMKEASALALASSSPSPLINQASSTLLMNRKEEALNPKYIAVNTINANGNGSNNINMTNPSLYLQTESSPRNSLIQGLDSSTNINNAPQQHIKNSQYFPMNKRKIAKVKNSSFTKYPETKLPYFEMRPAEQLKKKNKPSMNVPVSRVLSPNASNETKGDNQAIIHAVSSHFLKPLKNCLDTMNHNTPLYKGSKAE